MTTPKRYTILGVGVDAITMEKAAALIVARAADRRQPASYVVKPYVEFFDRAAGDAAVRATLNHAWLSLPDGVSTQWAATYLYDGPRSTWRAGALLVSIILRPTAIAAPIPERFGGTSFAERLLAAAAQRQLRVYLVGTPSHSIISTAAAAISGQWPGLTVVGTWPGELAGKQGASLRRALRAGPVETALLVDLKATQPDLILVGMGFPLQEELIAKLAPQLSHGVLIGEGGTFDYHSFGGGRRKAPVALQRLGLEWLWRLAGEPTRLRRQLAIPRFIWRVWRGRNPA